MQSSNVGKNKQINKAFVSMSFTLPGSPVYSYHRCSIYIFFFNCIKFRANATTFENLVNNLTLALDPRVTLTNQENGSFSD